MATRYGWPLAATLVWGVLFATAEVQTLRVEVAPPTLAPAGGGIVCVQIDGLPNRANPGRPALPLQTLQVPLRGDVAWETLTVDATPTVVETLPLDGPVAPAPPMVAPGGDELIWGADKAIDEGFDTNIYDAPAIYPAEIVSLAGRSETRTGTAIARLTFNPVRFDPQRNEIQVIRAAEITLTYESLAAPAAEMAPPTSSGSTNYVIVTTDHIVAGSTKLDDYVAHKEAQGYTVLVQTVEQIEASYTQALRPELFETTDERADRIRAFLKDTYQAGGYEYLMLVGSPDPDDPDYASDSVGDVPQKYVLPDSNYSNKDAATDAYYADLTGDWDSSGNGKYGEWSDEPSIDLAHPELIVGRIPYYNSDLTNLDQIFQKIIDYEQPGADESWRRKCLMPNPIDYTDYYGREGNTSPITMAEWIKNNVIAPAGFAYYRIYEHNFDYSPHNVWPLPEQIPTGLGYTQWMYYNSSHRFNAGVNVATDTAADYTITAMTDGSDATAWSAPSFALNQFLQFRNANQDDNWAHVAYKIVIRSTAKELLPQRFNIRMAANASFSDGVLLLSETDAAAHAVKNGSYWELVYEAPAEINRVGGKRFLRLTATASQADIQINTFECYAEQNKSIKSYVIPEWLNQYGVVYYNTHGSSTSASDVIYSSECSQLDDSHPSFIFSKACSTAYPESSSNLCASFIFNGGIGVVGASRVSYGWGDWGYQLLMPKLVQDNKPFGVVYGETCSDAAANNWYGWGGYFEDTLRFNLYGDPTVRLLTDRDGDTLPYWEEEAVGLDPDDPDTDGDGWDDNVDNCPLEPNPNQEDLDGNGIGDRCELGEDCNGNEVADWRDIEDGVSADCDANGRPDECDIADDPALDCNANGAIDTCDIVDGVSEDCDASGTPDECDVLDGSAPDCNANGVPDACDLMRQPPVLRDDVAAQVGWIDASSWPALPIGDDDITTVTLPFANDLFTAAALHVANDGGIGFGGSAALSAENVALPTSAAFGGAQALLPYWDDLGDETGSVHAGAWLPSPYRVFIVQWDDRPHHTATPGTFGDEVTFQLQLFELPRNGAYAQIIYQDTFMRNTSLDGGASATVGYQHDSGVAAQWSFNEPALDDGMILTLLWPPANSSDTNGDGVPDECAAFAAGDCNCDGFIDTYDIDAFVLALSDADAYAAAYPQCDHSLADCNEDGLVDTYDIDGFVALLTGN